MNNQRTVSLSPQYIWCCKSSNGYLSIGWHVLNLLIFGVILYACGVACSHIQIENFSLFSYPQYKSWLRFIYSLLGICREEMFQIFTIKRSPICFLSPTRMHQRGMSANVEQLKFWYRLMEPDVQALVIPSIASYWIVRNSEKSLHEAKFMLWRNKRHIYACIINKLQALSIIKCKQLQCICLHTINHSNNCTRYYSCIDHTYLEK